MSYHLPKLGAASSGFTLKLDPELISSVLLKDKCPEGERWNDSLERCIPVQEAERVSPERECPEGTRYSKHALEQGRDPCLPVMEARRAIKAPRYLFPDKNSVGRYVERRNKKPIGTSTSGGSSAAASHLQPRPWPSRFSRKTKPRRAVSVADAARLGADAHPSAEEQQ